MTPNIEEYLINQESFYLSKGKYFIQVPKGNVSSIGLKLQIKANLKCEHKLFSLGESRNQLMYWIQNLFHVVFGFWRYSRPSPGRPLRLLLFFLRSRAWASVHPNWSGTPLLFHSSPHCNTLTFVLCFTLHSLLAPGRCPHSAVSWTSFIKTSPPIWEHSWVCWARSGGGFSVFPATSSCCTL